MHGRSVASGALVALVGCTLLTDIPDDLTSGSPDAGPAHDGAVSVPPGITDAGHDDASVEEIDAGHEAGSVVDAGPTVVAFDAVFPSATGTGGAAIPSPLVWSHATSGVNRAIFVSVTVSKTPDTGVTVDGVTFGDTPLTQVGLQHSNDLDGGFVSLWALANPQAGTHSVSVAFSGGPDVIFAGSMSFTGVDQTTPYQNVTKVGGSGSSAKLTVVSSPGNMVIGGLVAACTVSAPGQSLGWINNSSCGGAGRNAAESAAPGASSVDLTYAIANDWWGLVGADVKAARP